MPRREISYNEFVATVVAMREKYDDLQWAKGIELTRSDLQRNCPHLLAQYESAVALAELTHLEKQSRNW